MSRDFNGSTQRIVDTAADLLMVDQPFTVSLWIYPRAYIESSLARIFFRRNTTGTSTGLSLNFIDTFGYEFGIDGSTKLDIVTADNTRAQGVWQHIAVTSDGTTNATGYKIYLNGIEAAYKTRINGASPVSTTGQNMILGDRGDAIRHLNGQLAEIGIWNVVLGVDEIKSLADGFSPAAIRPPSLRYYRPMVRDLTDVKGGAAIVSDNTTVANHPRIIN